MTLGIEVQSVFIISDEWRVQRIHIDGCRCDERLRL